MSLRTPLLSPVEEKGDGETSHQVSTSIFSLPSSRTGLWMQVCRRLLVHVFVLGLVMSTLWEIPNPMLGLTLPVVCYVAVGFAVPVEIFGATFLVLLFFFFSFGRNHELTYQVMLVLTVLMSMIVGLQKFRAVTKLQLQNDKKLDDDDAFDLALEEGTTREPMPPGLELDRLRWAEKQQIRERKQRRKQAETEVAVFAGVPLESVDTVVI